MKITWDSCSSFSFSRWFWCEAKVLWTALWETLPCRARCHGLLGKITSTAPEVRQGPELCQRAGQHQTRLERKTGCSANLGAAGLLRTKDGSWPFRTWVCSCAPPPGLHQERIQPQLAGWMGTLISPEGEAFYLPSDTIFHDSRGCPLWFRPPSGCCPCPPKMLFWSLTCWLSFLCQSRAPHAKTYNLTEWTPLTLQKKTREGMKHMQALFIRAWEVPPVWQAEMSLQVGTQPGTQWQPVLGRSEG